MTGSRTWAVVRREFLATARTKTFLLGTLFGPVLIALVLGLPLLFSRLSGPRAVVVVDATDRGVGTRVAAGLEADRFDVRVQDVDSGGAAALRDDLRSRVRAEEIDGVVWIGPDAAAGAPVVYEGRGAGSPRDLRALGLALDRAVQEERLEDAGIDPARLAEALRPVPLEVRGVGPDPGAEAGAAEDLMTAALAVTFALYMVLLLYGMAVLRGVREEKENRVVELILSSIRPERLMVGKVVGIGAAGLLQMTAWVAFAALAIGFGDDLARAAGASLPDVPAVPPAVGVVFLLCFLGGYFLYASAYAALGATAASGQDAQNVQMFATAPLMLAFFSVFAVIEDPTGTLARVGTLVPLTAPLVLPPRIALVPVPAWEIAASLAILAASCALVLWIGGRVYRIAILATGQRPGAKQIARWLRG